MDANSCATGLSFGEEHFGACDLGDARLTRRLVKTANRCIEHPGGTLPDKLNRNADLIGFYRLANNPKADHSKLIAAHCARTRELMARVSKLLVIHDTTEIDFSGLRSVADLGPIGHGGCSGYLCHNSVAYDYEAQELLGLANQTLHVRRRVPKRESAKARREHPQRESRLWKKGWSALGAAAEGQMRVNIADRGADMFEFIEAVEVNNDHYLIRSKVNRAIEIEDAGGGVIGAKLHDWARMLPTLQTREVQVQANHKQKQRLATVRIAAGKVSIKAPCFIRGEHSSNNLVTWVVHVREINPSAGATPLEWTLLTNVAVNDGAQAAERIDWYACRAMIEEYHKCQKTGCGIELAQFTTGHALQVAIAVLSVVATQLLRWRDVSRKENATTQLAVEIIDLPYVEAVSLWRFGKVQAEMSVAEFFMALAKLGGHLNRRHDGPPGWLVLWRGWTKLQLLVAGAQGERQRRCV